ncbi:MAG: alpha/beta hydrolase [Anaerolineae bacterium]
MSTVEKTTVYKIEGQALHVHEDGPQDATVALLIHGWSSSWYALSPLFPVLGGRYRMMAVDLPGYGESPRLPERTTIPAYVDLLANFIKQITNKPVVLIGHSMGGMISLTMALRYPELVERIVALCPTISGKLSTFINLFVSPITMMERFPLVAGMFSIFEPHMFDVTDRLMRPASFADRTHITQDEYVKLKFDARRPGQGRVRAECYWAMRNNDLRGKIGKLEVPTQVLWGMEDNTVPLRDASAVALEMPDADLRIIPNAGHWPQFEARETTRRYVKAFLGTPTKLFKFYDLD